MSRYRVSRVKPKWWEVRTTTPEDSEPVMAVVTTWEEAFACAYAYASDDVAVSRGVCPWSGETLVHCQRVGPCDCSLPRVEGPVDDAPACGHRSVIPGCGGCDPSATVSISDDALNLLALLARCRS